MPDLDATLVAASEEIQAPGPPENWIMAHLTQARKNAEAWLLASTDEFPYLELDAKCPKCMYVCKNQWRFQGLTGASGRLYTVGPDCPVLWLFDDHNPLRRRPPAAPRPGAR